ncbi:hypothetical protein Patl1_07060 [Pistacia atlantica]|uniref:Uncharacterized protein n=1 Tax=Pistacia atlantica TaxID=434234 RepID=A0ACC1ACX2_9ROSI|nr:hypothetical protein Patl1_07060 [Pistacia atlantica]
MEGKLNADGHTLKKTHQEVLDFNNLKSLKVHNCCNLRYIFTASIILRLAQLRDMEVKNCALIEEIILKEEEKELDIDKIMIPQLNSIILESLPNLTSFYSGMNTLECPALKAITITKCPEIETFIFTDTKHQSDHIAPLFSEKVMPKLESLCLDDFRLICHKTHNHIPYEGFCKLKELLLADHRRYLYFKRNPAQAALVFLSNDVTSHRASVTGGTHSSTLGHKRQDDDIQQMDKIKMEVGGKAAKIVLVFQQEDYPHRGLTIQVCSKSGDVVLILVRMMRVQVVLAEIRQEHWSYTKDALKLLKQI